MTVGNGNGSLKDPLDLERLASVNGARITMRATVRLPISCYAELAEMIGRLKLTGRLFVDFSQGTPSWVTWEGPKG